MLFVKASRGDRSSRGQKNVCYLSWNTWDDFGFKTTYDVVVYDAEGAQHDLGSVHIMVQGQGEGYHELAIEADGLDESHCSLGDNRRYYLAVRAMPQSSRLALLQGLQDCASEPARFERFEKEKVMQISLLRSATRNDVLVNFPRILEGYTELTPFSFAYHIPLGDDHPKPEPRSAWVVEDLAPIFAGPELKLQFSSRPHSKPPSNIHVVIGRNGVGKTRVLAGMADALTDSKAGAYGIAGRFEFTVQAGVLQTDFLNLVIVSFSAFDRFDPIAGGTARTETAIPYYYIGIKRPIDGATSSDEVRIKSREELNSDFAEAFNAICLDEARIDRWLRAIDILSSDPGIREMDAARIRSDESDAVRAEIINRVANMSSGHKIVLLTLARLIENVSDRSLVLVDEPETHLHPPLLGSFMRALSGLLSETNGVSIVATHSPVVLQEVPANCVWQLRRSGTVLDASRPDIETFAENVSVLTRKVFGLEVEQSGFYRLLEAESNEANFDDVEHAFKGRIGAEGRALLRAFTWKGDQ